MINQLIDWTILLFFKYLNEIILPYETGGCLPTSVLLKKRSVESDRIGIGST